MSAVSILADIPRWGHMAGWGSLMVGGWLLFLVLVGLLVWLIVTSGRGSERRAPTQTRAQALLDERYASGEISRDEYLERKADLER